MRLRLPKWPVLLACLCVLAGVIAGLELWLPYYRQETAIKEIQRLSGRVRIKAAGPQWLREKLGAERMRFFDEVTEVDLPGKDFDDAHVPYLQSMTKMRVLRLDGTPVSDAGVGDAGYRRRDR